MVPARLPRRRLARGLGDEPRVPHRLDRPVVGGPVERAGDDRRRARARGGSRGRRSARARGGPARAACSGRRSTARCTIRDTFARTRRAFARTEASTRTPRPGSAGRTPPSATASAPSASSACSIPILRARTGRGRGALPGRALRARRRCLQLSAVGRSRRVDLVHRRRPRGCGGSASRPSSAFARRTGSCASIPCIPPAWKGFEAWVRLGRPARPRRRRESRRRGERRRDDDARRNTSGLEPAVPGSRSGR